MDARDIYERMKNKSRIQSGTHVPIVGITHFPETVAVPPRPPSPNRRGSGPLGPFEHPNNDTFWENVDGDDDVAGINAINDSNNSNDSGVATNNDSGVATTMILVWQPTMILVWQTTMIWVLLITT
jgi:hypothetical protein